MIQSFLLTSALVLPAFLVGTAGDPPPVDPDGADSVLRIYQVSALMPRHDADSSWSRSLVFAPAQNWDGDDETPLEDFYDRDGPEAIFEILAQALGDELMYEGRNIEMNAKGELLVLAPEALQTRVANVLATLEKVLTSSTRITVDVVDIEGQAGDSWPQQNVIDAREVERMVSLALGRGGTHRRFEVGIGAGRTGLLDQMRRFPILADYDVEIAQGSLILDPVVIEIEEGVRMFLRGVPQAGGLAMSVVFQAAESLGVRDLSLECAGGVSREGVGGLSIVEGPSKVQQVDLLNRSAAFDTFLPDGRTIVLASQASFGAEHRTQIVFLSRNGGAVAAQHEHKIPDSSQTLLLVNTESFSLPTMNVSLQEEEYEGAWRSHPRMTAELDADPSLFLADWMKWRFSVWRRMGPWVVVFTDPAWDDDAASALRKLLGSWKPESTTLGVDVALYAQGGSARIPVRWSLPVRPGSDCGLMLGISSTALRDYDVEVAQYACAVDPHLSATFNGLCLSVTPSALAQGGYTLAVRGTGRIAPGGPRATFDPGHDMLGVVEQPLQDSLFVDEERVVGASETLSVGGRTKEGERPLLRLDVSVR